MLLCVLLCLSPDVVFLIGVVVGDGHRKGDFEWSKFVG